MSKDVAATWAHTSENDPAGLYDDKWEYAAASSSVERLTENIAREALEIIAEAMARKDAPAAIAISARNVAAAALRLIPPDAILIDPTAPETVAALAEALRTIPVPTNYEEWRAAIDRTYEADAAAILPAFVARLRGET